MADRFLSRRKTIIVLGAVVLLSALVFFLVDDAGLGRSGEQSRMPSGSGPGQPITAREGLRRDKSPGALPAPKLLVQKDLRPSKFRAAAFMDFMERKKTGRDRSAFKYYEEDVRSPEWADPMEQRLKERFNETALKELNTPGLKVDKVDCRSSTCRLDVSWDESDAAAVAAQKGGQSLDPLSNLHWHTGPLGGVESRMSLSPGDYRVPLGWNVKRREDGRYATSQILLFSGELMDPDDYAEQVAIQRSRRISNPNLP